MTKTTLSSGLILLCVVMTSVVAILEQGRDDQGNIVWKPASYRNRDAVPMPTNYDAEKKHRRDLDEADDKNENLGSKNSRAKPSKKSYIHDDIEESDGDDDVNDSDNTDDIRAKPSKKSFIHTHFSLPLGAQIPIGYSEKVQPKGKKSTVPRVSLEDKLEGVSAYKLLRVNVPTSSEISRSKVARTWGLTWNDPYPVPELNRDTKGYGRSNLEGLPSGKISEDEFDSGLMGRGLGGLKERAQNENLMEKKFDEKMEDESDVQNENRRRNRRFIFFPPHFHHYHSRHDYHGRRRRPQNRNQHPQHPAVSFPSANGSSVLNNTNAMDSAFLANFTPKNLTIVTTNRSTTDISNSNQDDLHQRQFKQSEQVVGASGGDKLKPPETNRYEYQAQNANPLDGEYDKQYPNGLDGSPFQYNNHDMHHNVFNVHVHSPYKMHAPHDDYKNQHPAHPYEDKMKNLVGEKYNFSTPLLEANKIGMKKPNLQLYDTGKHSSHGPLQKPNLRSILRHFLLLGGKIDGRHKDEDLSPAEIII